MKCLLITPPWKISDVYPNTFGRCLDGVFEPLGILYTATSLIGKGHDVQVLDGTFLSHEQLLDGIRRYDPDWMGVSSNVPLFQKAKEVVDSAKREFSDLHITLGGPAAIGLKTECLEFCEGIDTVVYGEGDSTAPELLNVLENGGSLKDVRGIAFRENGNNRMTKPMPLIKDLDSIPFPARELVRKYDYRPPIGTYKRLPSTSIFSSRGCPYNCIFCFKPEGRNIRVRSPENFIGEVDEVVNRYGVRELRIWDDGFTYAPRRAEAICDMLIERGYDLTWYASARVDRIDRRLLDKMRKAGCWAIMYGVESGVQKNLNTLKKGTTLDQIRKVVRETKKAGINVITPFMFGIPGETFEDGLDTIEFACSLDAYYANFHNIVPYPGTELYENSEKFGTMSKDIASFTFGKISFVPYTMTKEELIRLRTVAYKRFYGRPKFILKRLLSMRSIEDLLALYRGFLTFIYLNTRKNILDA